MKRWVVVFTLILFLPLQVYAATDLDQVNQKVCSRFEEDVLRLAAIMEKVRSRKGIKETRVAFGGIDDQVKSADYQITFAAEAIAYQRAQKFSGKSDLRYSLEVLKGKVLRAKSEIGKALNE